MKVLALHINLMFLAVLVFIIFKCSFHENFHPKDPPRNFESDAPFISWILILNFGSLSAQSFTMPGL